MQRYWDYSEKERSELTAEQVESLMVVELMEKGVTKIDRPILAEVEKPTLPTTTFYEVQHKGDYSNTSTGYVFATLAQAQAFVDAKPIEIANHYPAYEKYAKPCAGFAICPVEMPNEQAYLESKVALEKAKADKEANDKALKEYNDKAEAMHKATNGVWADWRECRQRASDNKRIIDTLSEYVNICDGDRAKAFVFLAKAFDSEQIAAACEWFGIERDVPIDQEIPEAPAEAPEELLI